MPNGRPSKNFDILKDKFVTSIFLKVSHLLVFAPVFKNQIDGESVEYGRRGNHYTVKPLYKNPVDKNSWRIR